MQDGGNIMLEVLWFARSVTMKLGGHTSSNYNHNFYLDYIDFGKGHQKGEWKRKYELIIDGRTPFGF